MKVALSKFACFSRARRAFSGISEAEYERLRELTKSKDTGFIYQEIRKLIPKAEDNMVIPKFITSLCLTKPTPNYTELAIRLLDHAESDSIDSVYNGCVRIIEKCIEKERISDAMVAFRKLVALGKQKQIYKSLLVTLIKHVNDELRLDYLHEILEASTVDEDILVVVAEPLFITGRTKYFANIFRKYLEAEFHNPTTVATITQAIMVARVRRALSHVDLTSAEAEAVNDIFTMLDEYHARVGSEDAKISQHWLNLWRSKEERIISQGKLNYYAYDASLLFPKVLYFLTETKFVEDFRPTGYGPRYNDLTYDLALKSPHIQIHGEFFPDDYIFESNIVSNVLFEGRGASRVLRMLGQMPINFDSVTMRPDEYRIPGFDDEDDAEDFVLARMMDLEEDDDLDEDEEDGEYEEVDDDDDDGDDDSDYEEEDDEDGYDEADEEEEEEEGDHFSAHRNRVDRHRYFMRHQLAQGGREEMLIKDASQSLMSWTGEKIRLNDALFTAAAIKSYGQQQQQQQQETVQEATARDVRFNAKSANRREELEALEDDDDTGSGGLAHRLVDKSVTRPKEL